MAARHFATPAEFRAWFEAHHATEAELLVGFHKKGTGRPSITWPESVDVALCFGWIDGVRRRIDEERYSIRFTPRKKSSIWSANNIARVAELEAAGLMTAAGLAAFAARGEARSRVYAYEQKTDATFSPEQEGLLRADTAAWEYFSARPAWYRRNATYWVVSAKREETRERRLATLIEDSRAGRLIKHLRPR